MSMSSLERLMYRPLDVRRANLTVWPELFRFPCELLSPELRIAFFDGVWGVVILISPRFSLECQGLNCNQNKISLVLLIMVQNSNKIFCDG